MIRKIAVLLTCFNRKEKTVKCLDSLLKSIKSFEQVSGEILSYEIFLVDDGSTDGTSVAVRGICPKIHIIQGDGQLYWAGGMRLAWSTAMEYSETWDYLFLINDDVEFYDTAFKSLLDVSDCCNTSIVSGLVCDSDDNAKVTYGGAIWRSRFKGTYTRLGYSDKPQECDMANANALLIPSTVFLCMRELDKKYTHGYADYDYTIRARKKGYIILLTPGAVGVCSNDHKGNDSALDELSHMRLSERRKYYQNPLHSTKDYLRFVSRVSPMRYPQVLFGRFCALYLPSLYKRLNHIRCK